MNVKTYGKAYRAAFAVLNKEESDVRVAKDKANAVGSIAAMVADGSLTMADVKKPNEPAMVAALHAVKA